MARGVDTVWEEHDLVMISALAHYGYCPRRSGLIHVEEVFTENVFTLRGQRAHERAHQASTRHEDGVRVERQLPLWSDRVGLTGRADVVEFHADGRVEPVEYKLGRPPPARGPLATAMARDDDLQLCAQAFCLEEMLGVAVVQGWVYSCQSRRRRGVRFTPFLREETERAIAAVRAMRRSGVLPAPVNDARCPNCSLIDACVPSALATAVLRSTHDVWRPEPP